METTEDFSLTSDQALNIARNDQVNMSLKKAQDVLDRFVTDRWLDNQDDEGVLYTLSLRSKVELQPFIEKNYRDSAFCPTCSELVTTGLQCRQCNTRIHKHCCTTTATTTFKQQQQPSSSCNDYSNKNMSVTKTASICASCSQPMNLFGLLLLQTEEDNDDEVYVSVSNSTTMSSDSTQ